MCMHMCRRGAKFFCVQVATPTPPSSVSRTGATAAPTAQRHFATARQQLSAKCRAMQDQAEHDLLQCDSSALLHRWGHQHQHTRAHGAHAFPVYARSAPAAVRDTPHPCESRRAGH